MKQWLGAALISGLVGLSFPADSKPRQHPIGECIPIAEAIVTIVNKVVSKHQTEEQSVIFVKSLSLSEAGRDLLLLGIPFWHAQFEAVTQLNDLQLLSIYNEMLNSCIEAEGRYNDGQPEPQGIET